MFFEFHFRFRLKLHVGFSLGGKVSFSVWQGFLSGQIMQWQGSTIMRMFDQCSPNDGLPLPSLPLVFHQQKYRLLFVSAAPNLLSRIQLSPIFSG